MRRLWAVQTVLAALMFLGATFPGEAPAQDSGAAIIALPVRPPPESPAATFADVALHLIGAPGVETLGIAVRATIVPKGDLTGKEKIVAYFYATCDDKPPASSAGVSVAMFEIGTLPAGRTSRTFVTTGTASSLVPLANVVCAKLALVCPECGAPPAQAAAYSIRKLAATLDPGLQDIAVDAPSLALVGEPTSKSFGIAFRGTVRPTLELTGDEKVVIRFYAGCAADGLPGPEATNVATVELGNLRKGRERFRLISTKDASAFVPMQDIGCAVIDLE